MSAYTTAYLKIKNADKPQWSMPDSIVPQPKLNEQMRLDMHAFEMKEDPFEFSFGDNNDISKKIVSTEGQSFFFTDKHSQMNFVLPSQKVFGLGERLGSFMLQEGHYTMFAHGQDIETDTRNGENQGYGAHPFVLYETAEAGQFAGMWFRSSNPQSAVISFTEDGKTILQYNAIGGDIEIHFIFYGTPEFVVKTYHEQIGRPGLPPFWALGWHQASNKYRTLDLMKTAYE